ncbi:hypothetical protein B0H13DRAFT_1863831 [Mycena leptocephala]|nr:hypothetical protein B0H13DRAFT_1863831 [Mycena leptocephala]
MPRQPTVSETRLKNLAAYLTPALALLDEITDAFGSSFIQPISKTTLSLFTTGKTFGSLHPSALGHLRKFSEYYDPATIFGPPSATITTIISGRMALTAAVRVEPHGIARLVD